MSPDKTIILRRFILSTATPFPSLNSTKNMHIIMKEYTYVQVEQQNPKARCPFSIDPEQSIDPSLMHHVPSHQQVLHLLPSAHSP